MTTPMKMTIPMTTPMAMTMTFAMTMPTKTPSSREGATVAAHLLRDFGSHVRSFVPSSSASPPKRVVVRRVVRARIDV